MAQETTRRVHVIACGVLAMDLEAAVKATGIDASAQFLPGGLHSTPHELRRRLQQAIDEASADRRADLIAVGYGVCGLGTVGIHARNVPLAVPRVNDCIALFLGSDAAYKREFARYPGTYYLSAGWVEEKAQPQSDTAAGALPTDGDRQEYERLVGRFGKENAEAIRYFMTSWQRNYQRAAFIDTGVGGRRRKYAELAAAMAAEFGWKYEELPGTGDLLRELLTQRGTSDEILIVPPHHVTAYDAVSKRLKAVPVWETEITGASRRQTLTFGGEDGGQTGDAEEAQDVRLGLGIDAGGTYTDVVLYDFATQRVIQKAKALTTKWDFTVGIGEALDALDAARLGEVDLVSLSTTLATNAIVEGRGQKVGLLIMPPYGLFDPKDITHRPIAILEGKLEIDGTELAAVNDEQVRRVVRDMVDNQQVGAFAVAGYASHNNPAHELRVKQIIQAECALTVTCGHDVSEGLNYRVRAATAALNARIIPCLDALLREMEVSLERRGIHAARMVVKSDGSLMSVEAARRRPIETILSGPAASVAGASHLAGLADAIVVDVGGTTTDTATIEGGAVRICQDGASVGGWRTHVKALDMRTLGLGGDSHIVRQRGKLTVGPRRVVPVCWLAARRPGTEDALDWIERHVDYFDVTTRGADLLALNDHQHKLALTDQEARVVDLLRARPRSAHELAHLAGYVGWQFLPMTRLEEASIVDRSALTPTDVLHVTGRVELWDAAAARRMCEVFAKLSGMRREQFAEYAIGQVVRLLAVELLKNQLAGAGQIDPEDLDKSPAARALVENFLDGGDGDGDGSGKGGGGGAEGQAGPDAVADLGGPGARKAGVCRPAAARGRGPGLGQAGGDGTGYRVRIALHRPIIGIGAPVHCFLPEAARLLHTRAIVPEHADVANAIGAIVSSVSVRKHVKVAPNEHGGYSLHGLPDSPAFANFEDAHRFAVAELVRAVRQAARLAGTRETSVEVIVDDRVADVADGSQVFIGRSLEARLTGRPDVARLARSS